MARWTLLRWAPVLGLGVLWWWGALRLVLVPERAGALEAAVVAGGWGLSLLPVHCVPKMRAAGAPQAAGTPQGVPGPPAVGAGERMRSWARSWVRERARSARRTVTTASRRRRSGGGSDPS